MTMTGKQYYFCVAEVSNYPDVGAYISDIALSAIWDDAPDSPIPPERLDQLRTIYTAATSTMRDIISAVGMTQAAFSEHFCIPRRTVEDWCRGVRECPLYTRLLMQQCLGLFEPPVK
jgi:hypothetical protein